MDTHGTDATGMLRARLRVDRPHATCVDPEALLRTLELLDALDHTTGIALTFHGTAD